MNRNTRWITPLQKVPKVFYRKKIDIDIDMLMLTVFNEVALTLLAAQPASSCEVPGQLASLLRQAWGIKSSSSEVEKKIGIENKKWAVYMLRKLSAG